MWMWPDCGVCQCAQRRVHAHTPCIYNARLYIRRVYFMCDVTMWMTIEIEQWQWFEPWNLGYGWEYDFDALIMNLKSIFRNFLFEPGYRPSKIETKIYRFFRRRTQNLSFFGQNLVLVGYLVADLKVLVFYWLKRRRRVLEGSWPWQPLSLTPLNKKNFDFQGSLLWFFNALKICY